jgi:molybdopterin-synthase adenylyltransferase
MWVPGFGEEGQRRLKGASVLVSRVGGLGGAAAYYLAAAGVGKLVLAHAGNVKPADLNRQTLMTHDWIGKPRAQCAARRLRELNPRLEVEAVTENVSEANVDRLVSGVDLVIDAAPMFEERFAMNRAAVAARKPMVECAMYELEAQITTILPGRTPCLRCLYPGVPPEWKREFPVFGAVSASVGCIAAMEAIKLIAGFGEPLAGRLLTYDLRDMTFRTLKVRRDPTCEVCGGLHTEAKR